MGEGQRLTINFFNRPTDDVGKALIGASLYFKGTDGRLGGIIVETEAYDEKDPASHTEYKKKNMNKSMYLSAGHIYIFPKSNFCHLNFVCGPKDYGSAVLIRALEPSDESKPIIRRRREKQRRAAATNDRLLCNGPMNLCQALGIGGELDGKTLDDVPVELYEAPGHTEIWCGPRIGVRNDLPRRYTLADSRFISHLNEKRYTLSANLCR